MSITDYNLPKGLPLFLAPPFQLWPSSPCRLSDREIEREWIALYFCGIFSPIIFTYFPFYTQRLEAMELWADVKQPQCPKVDGKPSEEMDFIRSLFSCFLIVSSDIKSAPPTLAASAAAAPPSKKASNLASACLSVSFLLIDVLLRKESTPLSKL